MVDDVYYSPARNINTYENRQEDVVRYADPDERMIRMRAYDPRWRYLDYDYNYYGYQYSPYYYGYNSGYYYNPYYYPVPVYSYNPYVFVTPGIQPLENRTWQYIPNPVQHLVILKRGLLL